MLTPNDKLDIKELEITDDMLEKACGGSGNGDTFVITIEVYNSAVKKDSRVTSYVTEICADSNALKVYTLDFGIKKKYEITTNSIEFRDYVVKKLKSLNARAEIVCRQGNSITIGID